MRVSCALPYEVYVAFILLYSGKGGLFLKRKTERRRLKERNFYFIKIVFLVAPGLEIIVSYLKTWDEGWFLLTRSKRPVIDKQFYPLGQMLLSPEFSSTHYVTNVPSMAIKNLKYSLRERKPRKKYNLEKWIQRASYISKEYYAAKLSTD